MQSESLYKILRIVGIVVLLLMAGAILYAGSISVTHWSGIGV